MKMLQEMESYSDEGGNEEVVEYVDESESEE